ncbi:hypothetical protein N9N67_02250 [Bacteriovoracaceae bacterium]|nr:hypothetical protein [Bacteriovoracaceae bacterium]
MPIIKKENPSSSKSKEDKYYSYKEVMELVRSLEFYIVQKHIHQNQQQFFYNLRQDLLENYYNKKEGNWSNFKF